MSFDLLERYGPRLIAGLGVTIELVALAMLFGGIIAAFITAARLSRFWPLRALAIGYIAFFRGTPLLAQTFLIYYGAGQFRGVLQDAGMWWFFREAFYCVVLAFSMNTAAYQAEILRGAIQSLPRGQFEAAKALGLGRFPTLTRVVLPQAFIVALRPYGNELILMIKGSAVASVVTIFDLMGATRLAFARTFDFSVYIWAAVLYLAVVEVLRRVWNVLEARLTRHLRPATG